MPASDVIDLTSEVEEGPEAQTHPPPAKRARCSVEVALTEPTRDCKDASSRELQGGGEPGASAAGQPPPAARAAVAAAAASAAAAQRPGPLTPPQPDSIAISLADRHPGAGSASGRGGLLHIMLQLKMQLAIAQAQRLLLHSSFERVSLKRVLPRHLAAALAALRAPQQDPPMEAPEEQHTFSVLTYNVWFDPTLGSERMSAVGAVIEDCHLPDFVLLQEATHYFYLCLAAQPFWRHYHAWPMPPAPPLGCHYFTLLLWRKAGVAGARCERPHKFASSVMDRDLKSVVGSVGGCPLRVSTTHLESPMGGPQNTYWKPRAQQHMEMMQMLDACPEPNCIVAGDMNWLPFASGDQPSPLPAGWEDMWLALRPDEPGWTYDSQRAPQKGRKYGRGARLDRLFFRLRDWEPLAVELVGTEPITGLPPRVIRTGKTARSDKEVPTWPSDHFGLLAHFVRAGTLRD